MKKLAFVLLPLILFSGCLYTSTYQKTVIPFMDKDNGEEPWITDLTAKNTKLLKNIRPKHYDSYDYPYNTIASIEMGCFHYFLADGALYKSNGSSIGTKIDDNIKDLKFSKLVKMNNKLFFSLTSQPSIFEVHPKEGYSSSRIYYFDQSKQRRKIVDFAADAYGDNFLMIVSRELKQSEIFIYELYLGDAHGSDAIKVDYELDTKADVTIVKVFIIKNMIYLLAENGSMYRSKNSKTLATKVIFLAYEPEKKVNSNSLISDENHLYFSHNKHIYKSNDTEFAKSINKEPISEHLEFYKIFNNNLIYRNISTQNYITDTKLCTIDLKTGISKILAFNKRPMIVCGDPPIGHEVAKLNQKFEFLSERFDKKIFEVVKKALYSLEDNDIKAFQNLIHPKNGIKISANTYFDDVSLHFFKNSFLDNYRKRETLFWGEDETKGDPINMNLYTYIEDLPKNVSDISKIIKLDNLKNFPNTKEQNIKGYEIYWVGEENSDYNWHGLVLLLQKYKERWYVVGMLVDYWTP